MSTAEGLIETAQRIAAEIAPRGGEIEAAGRLPPDISAMLGRAGFYRLYIQEQIGGLEVSPAVANRVFEALAQGDAASGWVAFIGATTGLGLSRMTNQAALEIFATPETLVAGVFAANGRATKVDGGFRVTGRWHFGSGSLNADWIAGGCHLVQDGQVLTASSGAPRNHLMFFPSKDVTSLNTWDVSGLGGTGSTAFEVQDVFVPERYASGFEVKSPPDRPLFRFPGFATLATGVTAVGLGIARAALDTFVALAKEKRPANASALLAERPHVQMEVAKAEARLRAARALYYEAIDAAWNAAQGDGAVPLKFGYDVRLANTHAMQEAAAVTAAVYTLAGATSIYRTSPLQRHFRDVHVATQHAMVSASTLETAGRLILGVPTDTNTLRY